MEAAGRKYIYYPSRSDEIKIWNLADLHLMNRATDEGRIKHDIQAIKNDPFSFWIGGGDYVDYIGYSDKRFDPDSVAPWVTIKDLGKLGEVGMHKCCEMFRPIADKCLGLLLGNHEKKHELRTTHQGWHGWLCKELGVSDFQYCAIFHLTFIRKPSIEIPIISTEPLPDNTQWTQTILAHHGSGYAVTSGGKLNRLIRFMHSFDADVFFCGHVHDDISKRQIVITVDRSGKHLIEKVKLGTITGSYLRTYAQNCTTYGEQRGYEPVPLGAVSVAFVPDKKEKWAKT